MTPAITPGPYSVGRQEPHGTSVYATPHRITVAWFGCATTSGPGGSYSISAAEAHANAHAFAKAMNAICEAKS